MRYTLNLLFLQCSLWIYLFFIGVSSLVAQPFITTWKTDNSGFSATDQISIPGTGTNYLIEWTEVGNPSNSGNALGNGVTVVNFPSPGVYRLSISKGAGTFTRIRFNNGGDRLKLLTLDQWGDIPWSSMAEAFYGCSQMVYNATDAPDFSALTTMHAMFGACSSFNGDLSNWDVSNVENMSSMFGNAVAFNLDISSWNTANVTNMAGMFVNAEAFNQDIGSWDVSKVSNMASMFHGAKAFNQDLNSWNTSNVTDMTTMFAFTSSFNQPIGSWDVSNVTSMYGMFVSADSFNQDIGAWNVSHVQNMEGLFEHALAFDQDIGTWDVSNVTSMHGLFIGANSFNQDIGGWDVSNVTLMVSTFAGAEKFNHDISSWDVTNVNNMSQMFENALAFDQDISNWNVSNVSAMTRMFSNAKLFNTDISSWNTSKVTNMFRMFWQTAAFDQDLSTWNVSNVESMTDIFSGSNLSRENYDNALIGWASQDLKDSVRLGAIGLEYCKGASARQTLIEMFHWDVYGDTLDCSTSLEEIHSIGSDELFLTSSPNPIHSKAIIKYQMPVSGHVRLQILDLNGHLVCTLVDDERSANMYEETFDSVGISAGVYLCRLDSNNACILRKVMVIK
ncbi:MAG TPA: BspA family leucine-rich repeat surface protein [Saprospiraceae bacterium]|nr:BspA family leucine-rich repeat surface protein [Saprospiraceae bacterium]